MSITKDEERQRVPMCGKLLRLDTCCGAVFTFHGAAETHLTVPFTTDPNLGFEWNVLIKPEPLPCFLDRSQFDLSGGEVGTVAASEA